MDPLCLLVAACWFAGGFVSGLTGIGGAMVAVPIAAMFIPMHEIIPLSCILNVAMDGSLAVLYFRHCRVSALGPLLLGAIPGSFVGLYILQMVSGNILQGAVGLLLIFYVWWQQVAKAGSRKKDSWLAGGAAGFGAGMLGTAISSTGHPPEPMPCIAAGSRRKCWAHWASSLSFAAPSPAYFKRTQASIPPRCWAM